MASSVREIEAELAELRADAGQTDSGQRTSVATHIAWVPPEWEDAAREVMAGLAERHPSRVILLLPDPDARDDELEATPTLQCFPIPGSRRELCAEVIDVRLRGAKAHVPASIVRPLVISDLPVFLRWRGELPFGEPELEELVEVADRLVVDGAEWDDPPATYAQLQREFDRVVVSDIAWARTEPWRAALARLWPGIGEIRELRVDGPETDALLLAAWLRARLGRDVRLGHDDADRIENIAVDGEPVEIARYEPPSTSDLLSDQLEIYTRDRIYEEAVRSVRAA